MAGRPRGWPGPPANQGYGPAPPAPGLAGPGERSAQVAPGWQFPLTLATKSKVFIPVPSLRVPLNLGGEGRAEGRAVSRASARLLPRRLYPASGWGRPPGSLETPAPRALSPELSPPSHSSPGKTGSGRAWRGAAGRGQSWNGGRESWRGGEVSLGLGGLPLGLPCPPLGALCQRRSRCLGVMPASPRDRVPAGAGTPVLAAE